MAVIVDVPGVGAVEARNAATESTLRELVNAINGMKGGSSAGAAGAGAAGAGAAGGMLAGLSKATKGAAKSAQGFASSTSGGAKSMAGSAASATKALGKGLVGAAGMGVKGIIGVAGAAKAGAEALAGLTAAAAKMISDFANVGNDLGNAAGTLAPIPIIGPALSATLGAVASAATATTGAFKEAASSGATFGGSVNAMARSASQAGMTIKDFASLIASSGEGLLAFGSTTEGGAKNFSALSKEVRSTSSDLYAMGFGTKEINEGLVAYGKQMRMQGRSGTMTNAQLAAGAKGYMKELDLLSKVTGKSRKAIEDQMEATAADGQFRAAMAGLGPDVESSANSLINSMPTKELQDFAKDLLANGTATTENSRALMAQFPQLSAQFTALHKQTQSNVAISKEQSNQIMNIGRKEGPAALKRIKTAAAADESLHGVAASAAAFGRVNENGVLQGVKDQKNAAKATDGQVESVEKAQEALAAFSNSFQMALANSGLLDLLMDAFGFLANIVQTFVIPAFNMLAPLLAKMFYGIEALAMPVIEALSGSLGSLDGVASFISDTLDVAFGILDAVVRSIIDVFRSAYGAVQRILEPFQRITERVSSTGDAMDGLTEIIASAGTILGGTLEFLGEIIGGTIDLFIDLWDWLMSFEIVEKMARKVADGFDTLKTYLSADGAKLLLAQVRDFFVNAIGGFFLDLKDGWDEFMIGLGELLGKVTFGAFGLKEEEAEEQRKAIEERKKEREEKAALAKKEIEQHKSNMMTTRAAKEVAETERKSANKNSRAEFSDRMKGIKGIGAANDKEAGVRKDALKGKEEAVKNFNDPIQLLMAEAKQQGKAGALAGGKEGLAASADLSKTAAALGSIKSPATPAAAAAQGAKASVEAEAEKKAEEAKKAQEAAKPTTAPTETPTTPPPGQTSGQTAIAQLNTSIEELVRLMRINNSLTSEQSSGLSRLAGSVTGDLFQI